MTMKIPNNLEWHMDRPRCPILRFILAFCLLAGLLAGCAMLPATTRSDRVGETGPLGRCAAFFAALDKRTEAAGVLDPGFFRVQNYPYLRVNRFVASFRNEVDDPAAFEAWTDRMQSLDQEARQYEIANLPDSAVAMLDPVNGRAGLNQTVAACGDLLRQADFSENEDRQQLRSQVSVPDDYIVLRRILGLYPLTRLFVSQGVSRWHAATRQSFSVEPPVDWQTIRYVPAPKIDRRPARQGVAQIKQDALGIPVYSPAQQEALFRMYAPVWEIETREGDDDRIGTPVWTDSGVLDVDTRKPMTYTLLSFTRFAKKILVQLNYIVWFPSRPKKSALDLYGGWLDGLNYRVTLDSDGAPLLYETVHNCGCYYQAYPTERLEVRAQIDYAEPPLVLKSPELDPSENFAALAVESRTHYVRHFFPFLREWTPDAKAYTLERYGQLRNLRYSSTARRSMFDQYGLVPGSDRLERFILWPMGVLSPGAMRQWGRHAVAFVGRRHFDDPFYMDTMFVETDSR
jgi:hypothetical protein